MHVSCPMVLVINPIASSTTLATARAVGRGAGRGAAAAAGGGGGFVERRSRDCGRHWQKQEHRSTWNAMVACRSSSSPKWKLMANIKIQATAVAAAVVAVPCSFSDLTSFAVYLLTFFNLASLHLLHAQYVL